MFTEEEIKERDLFLSLSQEDKEKYLEKYDVVILDMQTNDDNSLRMECDFSPRFHGLIENQRNDGETFEDATSRFVTNALCGLEKDIERDITIEELEIEGVLESIIDEFEINKKIIYHIIRDGKRVAVLVPYGSEYIQCQCSKEDNYGC